MDRDELAGWLRLTLTPGVGDSTARKLLAAFGLPSALFQQSALALQQVVSTAQANAMRREPPGLGALLDTTWAWLQDENQQRPTRGKPLAGGEWRHIMVLGDPDYPASLLAMEDPPLLLYLLGARTHKEKHGLAHAKPTSEAIDLIASSLRKSIAMVGSRNPTPQGLSNARDFGRSLSQSGWTVVSGLALGVDGAAHEGALEGWTESTGATDRLATIAVVGTGLDRVYPQSHRALAHRIADHGLIISEYPLGTPPLAGNFPKRNRLIAGLCQGTLVVEAAPQSGSLITARLAAEQGKDVFAIPGSIHAPQSRGCHALIKQGAKLVETVEDILDELQPQLAAVSMAKDSINARAETPFFSDDEADPLLAALGFDPVGLDALQARTGLDTPSLQVQLMTLELDGHVARLPGGLFQRVASA